MKRMRKVLSMVLTLTMILGLSVPVMAAGEMDGKLVILHTNDMHGYYETTESSIGIAGVAAMKDYYEAQGADVLLFDAGDFSQGTTLVNHSKGLAAAEYLAAAGYDAVTFGNHEFDFTFDALKDNAEILQAGGVQTLAANIVKKNTSTPYFGDRTTFEAGGMKIGVFGLDTAETQTKAAPSNVKDVSFLDGEEMFEVAQQQIDALKAEGCDYIIALTHLGVDDESIGRRSYDLANAVTGLDLIIDGHSHTVMDGGEVVNDILIVSTGSYLSNIGTVVVDENGTTAKLISCADVNTMLNGEVDADVAALVAEDKATVDAYYSGIFAKTEVDLDGNKDPGVRTMETNLGDFSADAYLYAGKKYAQEHEMDLNVVGAIANGGGIRASIPAGDISMNTLYTVFPYGNTLALVTISGAELLEVLEASTFCTPAALGGFPQVAGIEFTLNAGVEYQNGEQYPESTYYAPAAPGSRVTIESVGGEAFDPAATYTIVVNSFQAEGGDTYYALTRGEVEDTGIVDAEALISYVDSMDGVIGQEYAQSAGRITIINEPVEPTEPAEPETPVEPTEPAEPETPTVPEEEKVEPILYSVVKGDSLWKIAAEQLGKGSLWVNIYEDNKDQIADPDRIYVGQKLVINK